MGPTTFEWREEWMTPGVCLLARSTVRHRGIMGTLANRYMAPSGIWACVHANQAAIIGAPFAWEDADGIFSKLHQFLFRHDLEPKFITASHLLLDHSAGLSSLLDHFDDVEFVYPHSWPREWGSFSRDRLKLGLQPGMARQWNRDPHRAYENHLRLELAGEAIHLLEAPLQSMTDQLVIFRGCALLPAWHLPGDEHDGLPSVSAPPEQVSATVARLRQFEVDNDYIIHQSISVEANEPARSDFQQRLSAACDLYADHQNGVLATS